MHLHKIPATPLVAIAPTTLPATCYSLQKIRLMRSSRSTPFYTALRKVQGAVTCGNPSPPGRPSPPSPPPPAERPPCPAEPSPSTPAARTAAAPPPPALPAERTPCPAVRPGCPGEHTRGRRLSPQLCTNHRHSCPAAPPPGSPTLYPAGNLAWTSSPPPRRRPLWTAGSHLGCRLGHLLAH